MNPFEAIRAKALASILTPDVESFLRHVFRFYSKTFNVPLPDVDDLPLEDVLLAYYEEVYEGMDEEAREEYLGYATESDEVREARLAQERTQKSADEEFFDKLDAEVKAGKKRELPKERKVHIPSTGQSATARSRSVRAAIKAGVLEGKEAPPPEAPALPDIHMNFGTPDGNLSGEWADLDPLGPPPKKVP